MRRTTLIAPALAVLIVAGCTAGGVALGTAAPTRSAPPPATTAAADAWLVVGREGVDGLEVIGSRSEEQLIELPSGVPNETWSLIVAATPTGASTHVRVLDADAMWTGSEITIDGRWRLPTIGYEPLPVGGSQDGKTVVLVEADPLTDGPTRFAVLRRPLGEQPRIIELTGAFDFDALSIDGRTLFVIEHLDGRDSGRYQVRAVDVASGTLRAEVIADKRTLEEQMAGWPIGQMRRGDGHVLTLYEGHDHPFIHALNTTDATALCIDLPASHGRDPEMVLDWGMAEAGGALYAVNASLGHVVEIDRSSFDVKRTAEIEPMRSSAVTLAKFGHSEGGPVGRRVVAAPDGRTLFAAGRGGVVAIDTTDLAVRTRSLEGRGVESLGLSPDGAMLFALLADGGRIAMIDAKTGLVLGEVPGEGYDRLVAVMPR